MPELSVIFGTYRRPDYLRRCVEGLAAAAEGVDYELIVTVGQGDDGAVRYLSEQPRARALVQPLLGAVAAFNAAAAAARGSYVMHLNDDCVPRGRLLSAALAAIRGAQPKVGQIAFGHTRNGLYVIQDVHGRPYGNFSIIRREVVDLVSAIQGGFWSPAYLTYGADTEFSCWVWRLGFEVLGRGDLEVDDLLAADDLRARNHAADRARIDGKTFWARWPRPEMLLPRGPYPNVTLAERHRLEAYEQCAR